MIRASLSKSDRVMAWCRGKTGLIAFALCIAFVLVLVGISLSNQASPKNNLASFDCRFSSSTFSIEVKVELSDGMDQDEATSVAVSALKEVLVVNSKERIGSFGSSADLDSDGLWAVKLKLTHTITSWQPGHWGSIPTAVTSRSFEAIIDPINRTVECSFV